MSPRGSGTGTSGTRGKGETEQPSATAATRIGSLTKTMTASILLHLAEQKRLSLTETIDKYVPGMPNGSTATLRRLADMSSGIPSYTADAGWQQQVVSDPDKAWTPQELIGIVKDKPADFEPGHGWAYSNTNYVLLGMIIEQVTGENIADVFQERLFEPLGMSHSVFPTTSQLPTPHLSGITDQGMPAGEVISTLDDLTTWGAGLFTGTGILEPATQQERHDSIIRDFPPSYCDTALQHRRLWNRHQRQGRMVGPRRDHSRLHHVPLPQLHLRHHGHGGGQQ
ncbi:serine hydrolase domain-containing protein [Specibacter sp. NPDC078692]|uniref:serine hydrolase domain-containing protein n=1 Tax=Specibacter sp. NPDC078692 TaxID=3155818 RepID=UPI00342C5182